MFLRYTTRKKDGKEHRYYSLVENRRVAVDGWYNATRCLGEINDSQQEAWRKTIEIFEEGQTLPRTVASCARSANGKVAIFYAPTSPAGEPPRNCGSFTFS